MISDLPAWDDHDQWIPEFASCLKQGYPPVGADSMVGITGAFLVGRQQAEPDGITAVTGELST